MKSCLLLLLAAVCVWAQPAPATGDPVVLTVGAETFTRSQFEEILSTLPEAQQKQAQTPQGRRQIATQLAELKTLSQAAKAQKLDQTTDLKWKLALSADQVLAGAMFQNMGAKPDDTALRAYYNDHKSDFETAKAKHILIRMKGSRAPIRTGQKDLTDEEALAKTKELRAKIVAGGNFDEIAKAESDDTGSGQQGGELGEFGHGAMVKEFDEVAFSAKIGELSEPVKTQFGYHLIVVEERKSKEFDAVKDQIASKLGPQQAQKGLEDLKKKTPAVFDDAYFGPPTPIVAPVPAK